MGVEAEGVGVLVDDAGGVVGEAVGSGGAHLDGGLHLHPVEAVEWARTSVLIRAASGPRRAGSTLMSWAPRWWVR